MCDVLAYLRLIKDEDDDVAFERIFNVPERGLGGKTLDLVKKTAQTYQISLFKATKMVLLFWIVMLNISQIGRWSFNGEEFYLFIYFIF